MSNVPAVIDDDLMVGLEDFDESDQVMPRIDIVSREGVFIDTLSNEKFSVLDGVLLGLVKGRTCFDPDIDKKLVLCRSRDFTNGIPFAKEFPWAAAGFKQEDYPVGTNLSCEDCNLKAWGSHPTRGTSWCAEQHTFVLLRNGAPALLTLQRSAMPASRKYLSSFANAKTPLFVAETKITLTMQKKGGNEYAVPSFARGAATDQEDWPSFANKYRGIRTFLQTPRDAEDETPAVAVSVTTSTPSGETVTTPVAPEPAVEPAVAAADTGVVTEPVETTEAAPAQPAVSPGLNDADDLF